MELSELKKALKPLGFTVQVRTMTHGKHGTIKHVQSGKTLTANVFTEESLKFWSPAIETCKKFKPITSNGSKVYGLAFL